MARLKAFSTDTTAHLVYSESEFSLLASKSQSNSYKFLSIQAPQDNRQFGAIIGPSQTRQLQQSDSSRFTSFLFTKNNNLDPRNNEAVILGIGNANPELNLTD